MAQIKTVDQPTYQPSRLLSLPLEIRLLIWKATMPSTPLLIYPTHKPFGKPLGPFCVNCVHPTPDYLQNSCFRRHNPLYGPGVVPVRPRTHPESWLLADRQIYTEAYPLLTAARLRIHTCRPLALVGYLACPPVASPQPAAVRSLTFCQSISIRPVKNGYMLGDMDPEMWVWRGHV